jgi:hypothetical protein
MKYLWEAFKIIFMCQVSSSIKFCSCADNLAEATKNAKSIYYIWTLNRLVRVDYLELDGIFLDDPLQLDELYAETIVKALNEKNLFDFEYTPNENDQLKIERVNPKKRYEKKKLVGIHLDFYYSQDKWHIGTPKELSYEYEVYKNGKVEGF